MRNLIDDLRLALDASFHHPVVVHGSGSLMEAVTRLQLPDVPIEAYDPDVGIVGAVVVTDAEELPSRLMDAHRLVQVFYRRGVYPTDFEDAIAHYARLRTACLA